MRMNALADSRTAIFPHRLAYFGASALDWDADRVLRGTAENQTQLHLTRTSPPPPPPQPTHKHTLTHIHDRQFPTGTRITHTSFAVKASLKRRRTQAQPLPQIQHNPPITAHSNPRIPSPSFQPPYPSPPTIPAESSPSSKPQVRVSSPTRWSLRNAFIAGGNPDFASPFRARASSIGRGRPRRPSAARLWNPSNSTPRGPSQRPETRRRRDRSQEVIAVPLQHPDIGSAREGAAAGGEYPLLTLPEQRQKRHSGSTRASLQVERSGSSTGTSQRISLPRSVSIDIARKKSGEHSPTTPKLDKGKGIATEEDSTRPERQPAGFRKRGQSVDNIAGLSFDPSTMADLERGPDASYEPGGTSNLPRNASNQSLPDGIGPALSSEDSSIIGSDGPVNAAEEWGPQHPCFPHMNPHVPLSSPLYQTTRIIRIRRDWMIEGDLAPTFSNLYPEILDPAGVSEQEFRGLIERVNSELIPAFSPWGLRNMLDAVLGLLTGWIWDDLGLTAVKSRLSNVERYLEQWNREMEDRSKEGPGSAPRIVPLRRTGYMNLDIQVPDPEISYPSSIPPEERTATGLSRVSQ